MDGDIDLQGLRGLTAAQAAERLARDGENRLPHDRPRRLRDTLAEAAREPMFLLLAAVVIVYALLGDFAEAALLSAMVLVVIGLTIVQQRKTEHALSALRTLAQPTARVIRDGQVSAIPGVGVVRGDLLLLEEGDRVPADVVLRAVSNLQVDESLLTGESVPVGKRGERAVDGAVDSAVDSAVPPPGGENTAYAYAGTLVVRGRALGEVLETGTASAIGRIGVAMQAIEGEPSPLQRETAQLVRIVGGLTFIVCAVVVVVLGAARGDWLAALLAALALAISLVPEEFPVVLTVFVALGAWRISRTRVLARRLAAVETLGAMTVLALDKTGTLTENRMQVARLIAAGAGWQRDESSATLRDQPALRRLLATAALASHRGSLDPMERAIAALAADVFGEAVAPGCVHLREYPLTPERLVLTHAWQTPGDTDVCLAAKGAPEAIARLCGGAERHQAQLARADGLAAQGLRVLGVAQARVPSLPADADDLGAVPFELLGFVALADPLRADAAAAIAACHQAGVRVLMLTGDYPATAMAIARQAGLRHTDAVVTGAQLDQLTPAALANIAHTHTVFARVQPLHKLALVRALQARGEVVGMTGDGVNDAPALRAADIGIAMGGRGSEVAREAAALVLLDDAFPAIVAAIRVGRRIYGNLRKAMSYIVAIHVLIAGVALIPVVMGGPLLLLPAHIVFLELVIDPACSIAFEADPEPADVMNRPPRRRDERLLGWAQLWPPALAALGGLGAVVGVVYGAQALSPAPLSDELRRALAFTMLVLANLVLIFAARSGASSALAGVARSHPSLWIVVTGTVAALLLVLNWAPLRSLFDFAALSGQQWVLIAASAASLWLFIEGVAVVRRYGARAVLVSG